MELDSKLCFQFCLRVK